MDSMIRAAPHPIVVMGVSGCGKSTLASALAVSLGWPFQEGDALHSAGNIAKMKAGLPLTEADRGPWLEAVSEWLEAAEAEGEGGVVSCSALKRLHRDRLRQACPSVRFVYLNFPREVLAQRLLSRQHFMSPSLLDDQLRTLEPPSADEDVLTLSSAQPVEVLVAIVRRWLGQSS